MNNTLEKGVDRLKNELKQVESELTSAGQHLAAAVEEKIEALDQRWKNALVKYEARIDAAGQTAHGLREFLAKKKEELTTKFEDWKADREIEKIEKQADQREQQAVEAIVVAAIAMHEAEVAILAALKARKFAVEVAG